MIQSPNQWIKLYICIFNPTGSTCNFIGFTSGLIGFMSICMDWTWVSHVIQSGCTRNSIGFTSECTWDSQVQVIKCSSFAWDSSVVHLKGEPWRDQGTQWILILVLFGMWQTQKAMEQIREVISMDWHEISLTCTPPQAHNLTGRLVHVWSMFTRLREAQNKGVQRGV